MTPISWRASRPVAALAVALLLVLASAAAAQRGGSAPQPGQAAYLVVLSSRLNVRSGPSLDSEVVGATPRGARLCVVRFAPDWVEVVTPVDVDDPTTPLRGFVARGFVRETRATPEEVLAMGCLPRS